MRICIVGATGLVGRETLALIERAWPSADKCLFASRDQTLEFQGASLEVGAASRLEASDAPRGDLALVALDDDYSKRYVPRLLELGYRVVDKSNTYRLEPRVPLVVAGANCGRVTADTKLVANPNCTTIPFSLAMRPVGLAYGLRSASISTYQAISGAGIAALDTFLEDSRKGYAQDDRLGLAFSPTRYAGNVVPHAGKTDESGFSSEERKLVQESAKILERADFGVCAQANRVPVAVGHFMTVWLTLERPAPLAELAKVWDDHPFVRVIGGVGDEGLTALDTVHDRDRALVGRLRLDPRDASGRTVCMTITADNLRLGAATNAVRIASRWFPSADPQLQAPGLLPA